MKSTYETIGGEYRQDGDYLLPNLEVPESPKVGVWGERRRKYLREHQQALYTAMMLGGTLNTHLEEVDVAPMSAPIQNAAYRRCSPIPQSVAHRNRQPFYPAS